ncbi:hypothetical protein [Cellulomonas phragmiteti]|uniref:Lipoprotein n=1 Tax=Cellulomonas phragmiteti TaxID=478780 RepID=A0ABQ4DH41_9CELL|nr:hypothetical protein [Cellulomonas phragmiteti]GIG38650.1 hypothetical protein Cph01nite_04120 [Cellulomonas phragmiteti]
MAVRRTRGRVRVVAAAVVVGGVLAGCAGQPGAAAVVDGRTITTAELATAYEQLTPIFNGAGPQDVLGVLITEPFAAQVAADEGVGVNDEQAMALLRQVAVQAVGEERGAALEFGPGAIAVARYSLAASALQDLPDAQGAAEAYQERVAAADIEVNPRYGEFTDDLVVAPPAAPSWVVPEGGRAAADDATPEPSPTP